MIDLSAINIQGAVPHLLDWGSEQTAVLGGVSSRVDRLGSKHQIDVTVPPLVQEPDGRIWVSRLKRAKSQGGIMQFPQLDLVVGSPGAPVITTAAVGGTSIAIGGVTHGYVVREGQWLTITSGGRGYLYSADADAAVDTNGHVTLTITPMLRAPAAVGDIVNLVAPTIEGWIGGDDFSWTVDNAHHVGLQFSITERA